MRRLARRYPRRWRDRYGTEIEELLAASRRPWRDGVNVAVFAAFGWLEVPMVKVVVMVLAAASLVLFGFTVGQLADGVSEIHQHWWSSASAGLAVCAVGAVVVVVPRRDRAPGR